MPRAYSYIRFSTPEQAKGDSLRRQTELSEKYAREHGLQLDGKLTFRDLGKSAFHGKNVKEGELGDFIAAVESGKVKRGSFLLMESLDRLSRQGPFTAINQLATILRLDITVVTLSPAIEEYTVDSLDTSFSKLIVALTVMARAHEESATKSKRVKAAWTAKRKRAIESGAPMTAAVPAWIVKDKATGKLKLNPERAKVVRRIFEEAAKGVGHHTIARTFNKRRVPPISVKRNSQAWWSSYVLKILHNSAVIGHYQPCKMGPSGRIPEGDVISDYYPRVISDSLYYKVRDMRASRRIPSGRKGSNGGNLFTGLARCYKCKSAMHRINKGKAPKGYAYLVCGNALRHAKSCQYRTYRLDDFELGVLNSISDKVDWRNLGRRIEAHSSEVLTTLEQEYSAVRLKIDRVAILLRGIAAEMAADLADGHGTSPNLRDARRKAEKEHAALAHQIADVRERLEIEQNKAVHAKESAKDAHTAFREWLQKYSTGAGHLVPKQGVSEVERKEARERLRVILNDLVEAIWFGVSPEHGGNFLKFRHGASVPVLPFNEFDEIS